MSCTSCGECCCSVAFSDDERYAVRKIARKMNIQWKRLDISLPRGGVKIRFLPYTEQNYDIVSALKDYKSLVDSPDIPCPFLLPNGENKTKCACYENRPDVCRKFGTIGAQNYLYLCEKYTENSL